VFRSLEIFSRSHEIVSRFLVSSICHFKFPKVRVNLCFSVSMQFCLEVGAEQQNHVLFTPLALVTRK